MTGGDRDSASQPFGRGVSDRERVVVVAGAASPVGQVLARGFLRDGVTVVGWDCGADMFRSEQVCARAVACDLRDISDIQAAASKTIRRFGGLDALIVCADAASHGAVLETDTGEIRRVLEENVYGPLRAAQAVAPRMLQRGGGRIVLVGSRYVELCPPGALAYTMSKSALAVFMRALACELDGSGVLVNMLLADELDCGAASRPYATARLLAELPSDGPNGRVFRGEREYALWARFGEDGILDGAWDGGPDR